MVETFTFSVDTRNADLFDARFARLQSACEVHNCELELTYLGRETRDVKVLNEQGKVIGTEKVDFDNYTLTYEEPEQERYAYVGVMHRVGDSNILDVDPWFKSTYIDNTDDYDIDIPDEIYKVDLVCEHCLSGRLVKRTFVIFDFEANVFFQVAKGCLTGYIYFNHNRNVKDDFESLESYYERSGGWQRVTKTIDYEEFDRLCKVALQHYLSLEKLEYVSSMTAYYEGVSSTHRLVMELLENDVEIKPEVEELYPEFINFILKDSKTDLESMKVMMEENLVPDFKRGYLIYLAFKFLRYWERKDQINMEEELKKASNYVGVIGDKIETEVMYYRSTHFETMYGSMYMHFFKDNQGNVFVWGTGKNPEFDEGEYIKIKAKIKDHREYRGTKQTFINYVKFESVENKNK
jgi:hypothetical protein